jgi:hypothetical protein
MDAMFGVMMSRQRRIIEAEERKPLTISTLNKSQKQLEQLGMTQKITSPFIKPMEASPPPELATIKECAVIPNPSMKPEVKSLLDAYFGL